MSLLLHTITSFTSSKFKEVWAISIRYPERFPWQIPPRHHSSSLAFAYSVPAVSMTQTLSSSSLVFDDFRISPRRPLVPLSWYSPRTAFLSHPSRSTPLADKQYVLCTIFVNKAHSSGLFSRFHKTFFH